MAMLADTFRAIDVRYGDMKPDESRRVYAVIHRDWPTLDAAERWLMDAFPEWFVRRAPDHIALHRTSGGKTPWLLLIGQRRKGIL